MSRGNSWNPEMDLKLKRQYHLLSNKDMASIVGRTINAVKHRARILGLKGRPLEVCMRKHTFYMKAFNKYSLEACYWAGFLAADGHLCNNAGKSSRIVVTLAKKDKEHLEKLRKFLKSSKELDFVSNNGYGAYRMELYGCDEMILKLSQVYGICTNKRHMFVPNLGGNRIWAYVAGFIDGEGSLIWDTKGLKYISFANQCRSFAADIAYYICMGDRKLSYYRNSYHVGIGRPICKQFYDRVVKLDIPLLERKWKRNGN